jgi:hypothetical protein
MQKKASAAPAEWQAVTMLIGAADTALIADRLMRRFPALLEGGLHVGQVEDRTSFLSLSSIATPLEVQRHPGAETFAGRTITNARAWLS